MVTGNMRSLMKTDIEGCNSLDPSFIIDAP
jgi:hypothetical protein